MGPELHGCYQPLGMRWKSAGGLRFSRKPLLKAAGDLLSVLRVWGNIRAAEIFTGGGSEAFDEGPEGQIRARLNSSNCPQNGSARALRRPRGGFVGFREARHQRGVQDGCRLNTVVPTQVGYLMT